jgi:hypothetical protein
MGYLDRHLKSRYLNTRVHRVWVNEEDRVATFPLWNLSGQMVGYQAYRPDADKMQKNDEKGRYYTYRGNKHYPKHSKTVAVWGMESWSLSDTLFLTEGVFDATRITYWNVSAVALLSNHPNSSLRAWLKIVSAGRKVVLVLDRGESGGWLRSCSRNNSSVVHLPEEFKDLGEASEDYVEGLINEHL